MESILWQIRALDSFGELYLAALFVTLLFCWDYVVLVPRFLLARALYGEARGHRARQVQALPLLVVIPSLLRERDELSSLMSTVESIATNGYPAPLTIVVTIDGTSDAPPLWSELRMWAARQGFGARTALYVTGTPERRSKPMAIDHAMHFVKALVAQGELPEFPPAYVSTDADADLGSHALEAIVLRLQRRNSLTGSPARVVAGALHVRGNSFWRGWRQFFTIAGQLNLQVAREYYVGNIWRHNIRALPITGVPGAFYCTWSEIFLTIPSYFGYLRTLNRRHWLMWWVGVRPPRFSDSQAAPIPELVAGDTDDTVTAYLASIARWENGRFTFEAPPTPLHAFFYMLRSILIDRALHYEPSARVYTSSPTTIKSLFRQRKRWNSSRIELTGRFWRALGYHWSLGLPVMIVKALIARSVILGGIAYVYLPLVVCKASVVTGFLLGYFCQILVFSTVTFLALLMNAELDCWRMAIGLPLAPLYNLIFNFLPGAAGAISDVLLFGNITGFSPEWTLKRGRSERIALLYRLRRAVLLAVRSVLYGDVPFGSFWFGWGETPWTPSGFDGWTTRKKPRPIVPRRSDWLRARSGQPDPAGGTKR